MAIKKGDFIELDFTGKDKETGEIFDTTDEAVAKKQEIHAQKSHYGPVIVCVGEGVLLAGLERKIEGKDIGKHKIELAATEAFGNKDAKYIQMIPASKFKEQKIQPFPGLQLNIDGMIGTVKTSGGGRILVDFNHPLSGKAVVYEIDIKRVVSDKKEQIQALLELGISLRAEGVEIHGENATITLKKQMPAELAEVINKKIIALCGVKAVEWKVAGAQSIPAQTAGVKPSEK